MNIYRGLTKKQILDLSVDSKIQILDLWNAAYRNGNSIVVDAIYDEVLESLPKNHPRRGSIGFDIPESDSRKEELPVELHSAEKCKSTDEFLQWCDRRGLSKDTVFVITPKYDGISLLIKLDDDPKVWTRGRKGDGRRSDKHFEVITKTQGFKIPASLRSKFVNGEAILPKKEFLKYAKKDGEGFENPRSFVSSMFARDDIDYSLVKDVEFICYSANEDFDTKENMIKEFNKFNVIKVLHRIVKLSEITDEYLQEMYMLWSNRYEIDGLIIEINDPDLRKKLGRETNGNPKYMRAWKGFSDEKATTTIQNIVYQISKEGNFCPVAEIDPVRLEGTTVKRVTLNNAGYILKEKCGVGSQIEIIKSGKIIPKVVSILKESDVSFPKTCPSCKTTLTWNENKVHLICSNHEKCPEQRIERLIAFLKIMQIEGIAEGTVRKLYENGIDTVEKLTMVTSDTLVDLEGFASKKAKSMESEIRKQMKDVPLERVQHALGMFKGLGSKTLALLNEYDSSSKIPTVDEIVKIDGFSDISANIYCDNIKKFWDYMKCLPISIKKKSSATGTKCKDMIVVFTQFRDGKLEELIEQEGGYIGSSVSGKTTHVVCVNPDDATGKVQKAKDCGCTIWVKEDLQKFLGVLMTPIVAKKTDKKAEEEEGLDQFFK